MTFDGENSSMVERGSVAPKMTGSNPASRPTDANEPWFSTSSWHGTQEKVEGHVHGQD